ncbi:MAG: L-seryl-tRNA(Sec) selenium transferase [Defluviitaleaceae bacterium]|nr:L-seryl-tRNA(Sec) selenium transferase [Defluviitaleaceae bacterium]
MQAFRNIPKVDELLRDESFARMRLKEGSAAKAKIVRLIREDLDALRAAMAQGKYAGASRAALYETTVENVCRKLEHSRADRLQRVVNATGVVMHTNLGRSVLSEHAAAKLVEVASGYSNLEYSTQTGARRPRLAYIEQLLTDITGAEAALVTNNNAAAVFLALNTLTAGRSVVISRGEMVEIGDGFRIGEIITTAGCHIVEVGATNRTTAEDYRKAIAPEIAALVKIHTSNYRIVGYGGDTSAAELAPIAAEAGIPLIEDMGSGVLTDLSRLGFPYERTPMDAIADGVDIVTFSGDKCLGGPQAGIIVGKKAYVDKLRRNQIMRCLRIDKLCLAALEATLEAYAEGEDVPTIASFGADPNLAKDKAEKLCNVLEPALGDIFNISVQPHNAQFGGGAMPLENIASYALYVTSGKFSASAIEAALRGSTPPVITMIHDGCVILNMLTVKEGDFCDIAQAFRNI